MRQELTRVTEEQTTLGRMSAPMTRTELYREIFGTSQQTRISQAEKLACPLISLRFRAPQKGKIRPIEDRAASGFNKSLFMRETIAPITFDCPAIMSARIAEVCRILRTHMPEIAISMDDVAAGYNNCPAAHKQFFCMWNAQAKAARFYASYVCGFGNAASVLSFCRLPELIGRFMARMFGTFGRAYIDDWVQPDLAAAGSSAQDCLAATHKAIGIPLAACLHPACSECNQRPTGQLPTPSPKCKRRRFSQVQEVLGVICDTRLATRGIVDYSPAPTRCQNILTTLDSCARNGMSASVAERLAGKINFVTHSSIFGGVARAPTLAFYRRAHHKSLNGRSDDFSDTWTQEMETARMFLHAILTPEALPSRRVIFNDRPPVTGYSDAEGDTFQIGLVFCDPARADKHPGWFSSTQTPKWILAHIMDLHPRDDTEGIINCIELLGAICLLLTYQEEIWGRKISIFQDNSTAFYTMISGASGSPALAALANIYHLVAAAINMDPWVEWASTKAMIADIPSRMGGLVEHEDLSRFHKLGLEQREAVFPSPSDWADPISFYHALRTRRIAGIRARATSALGNPHNTSFPPSLV